VNGSLREIQDGGGRFMAPLAQELPGGSVEASRPSAVSPQEAPRRAARRSCGCPINPT